MSCEIAKSVKIGKNGNIIIVSRDNRIYPNHWHTLEPYRFADDQLFSLFLDLISLELRLQTSCSKKIRYALVETKDYIQNNKINRNRLSENPVKIMYEKLAKEAGIKFTYLYDDDPNFDFDERHKLYVKLKETFGNERLDAEYRLGVKEAYSELYKVFLNAYNNYRPNNNKYVLKLTNNTYLGSISKLRYRSVYSRDNAKLYDYIRAKELFSDVYNTISKEVTIERY